MTVTILYELAEQPIDNRGEIVPIIGNPLQIQEIDGSINGGSQAALALEGNTLYVGIQPLDNDCYFSFTAPAGIVPGARYAAKVGQIVFVQKPNGATALSVANR